MNRRTLLKMLAMTSAYSCVHPAFGEGALSDPPAGKQVFLLLHGMFFLEFDLNAQKLIVATPVYTPHFCYTRLHGTSTLNSLEHDPVLDVVGGSKNSFPPEILQFKRADIGANGPVLTSSTAQYRSRMILPFPKDILPLRRGPGGLFMPDTSMGLGKNIQIGAEVATVTCLVYDPGANGPYAMSYYAEHPARPDCKAVNDALVAAQTLCGNGFKLKLKQCPAVEICTERDDELPDGVNANDERSIGELDGPGPCAHPPAAAEASKAAQGKRSKTTHRKKKSSKNNRVGGDVSSCPQFGIQP